MPTYLKPGVYLQEMDLSEYVPYKPTFECHEVPVSDVGHKYGGVPCPVCRRLPDPETYVLYMSDYGVYLCNERCREMFIFQNI